MANIHTFALIKSAAAVRGATWPILVRLTDAGLAIRRFRPVAPGDGRLATLYEAHVGRPYYDALLMSVNRGAIALLLEAAAAVRHWRELMGATDPKLAAPGTLRADFGRELPDNAVHGSDSPEAAAREIGIFWPT